LTQLFLLILTLELTIPSLLLYEKFGILAFSMNQTNQSTANMKKVALTSLAGTSIEWYDFFLYGASAALIFPTVFFGETTPSTALI